MFTMIVYKKKMFTYENPFQETMARPVYTINRNGEQFWVSKDGKEYPQKIERNGKTLWLSYEGEEYATKKERKARNEQLRRERRKKPSEIVASGKSKAKQKRLELFKDYFGFDDGQKKYVSGMVISLRLNPSELEPVVRFAHRMKKKSLGEAVKFAIRKQFYGKRDIKRIDSVSTEAKTIEKANKIIELNKKLLIENNEYEKIIRKLIEMHDQFSIDRELHKDE